MTVGILIGHFEPLHLGHLRDIHQVASQVTHLHIIVTPRQTPHPLLPATLQDKARWLHISRQAFDFISIHTQDSLNLSTLGDYEALLTIESAQTLLDKLHLSKALFFVQSGCAIYSHNRDNVMTISPHHLNSQAIFDQPARHFFDIAPSARPHYTQTVCIAGAESSGKTTLAHKLANHFGATIALEMGRLYVHTHLGGSEIGLQYIDYPLIATQHLIAIQNARQHACSPVVIVDTDFVATQAFCQTYEHKSHPLVNEFIDNFKMHHTLLLASNVPWVTDGMRSLGSSDKRQIFYQTLQQLMSQHDISPYVITCADYHQRYLQAVDFIEKNVFGYSF